MIATADDKGQFTKGTIVQYTSRFGAPAAPMAPARAHKAPPPEQQHDKELPK